MDTNFSSKAARFCSLACVTIMVATQAEIKLKCATDDATVLLLLDLTFVDQMLRTKSRGYK